MQTAKNLYLLKRMLKVIAFSLSLIIKNKLTFQKLGIFFVFIYKSVINVKEKLSAFQFVKGMHKTHSLDI